MKWLDNIENLNFKIIVNSMLPAIGGIATMLGGGNLVTRIASGGAVDKVRDTVNDAIGGIGNIIGVGGGEKGSGQTVSGTIAHAIDQFEKANDNEALSIAPVLLKKANAGASDRVLASYMARSLGYANVDSVMSSSKWKTVLSRVRANQDKSVFSGGGRGSSVAGSNDGIVKKAILGLGGAWLTKNIFGW